MTITNVIDQKNINETEIQIYTPEAATSATAMHTVAHYYNCRATSLLKSSSIDENTQGNRTNIPLHPFRHSKLLFRRNEVTGLETNCVRRATSLLHLRFVQEAARSSPASVKKSYGKRTLRKSCCSTPNKFKKSEK